MEFPRQAKYLLDWSPACGLSYREFLEQKQFDTTLHFAIPADIAAAIGSAEQLEKRGFVAETSDGPEGFTVLSRNVSGIEQSVRLGASDITSSLRWAFAQAAIGLPMFSDSLKQMNETLRNAGLAPAYEQFVRARENYNNGKYYDALSSVLRAIDGAGSNPAEFRFYYLLGRIHLGSWFSDYKNTSADIIDPAKAETAFLNAARHRKSARAVAPFQPEDDTTERDIAHIMLWAGRAAYAKGDTEKAVAHTKKAIDALSPANEGLFPAACYQYARMLCTRAKRNDDAAATEYLQKAIAADRNLMIEAAGDPEFFSHPPAFQNVLTAAKDEIEKRFIKLKGSLDVITKRVQTYTYDDTPAEWLLQEESAMLLRAQEAIAQENAASGILDMEAACSTISAVLPKPGFLFGIFKTRFSKDRLQKWENMPATREARDAVSYQKWCEDELKKAEDIYRQNGGFNRNGGADKFGYSVICALLAIYMFIAQAKWGGNAIILAIILLIASLSLFLLYLRVKMGLVEGYEKYRAARIQLGKAIADGVRKDAAAAKAWQDFQRVIDTLNGSSSPF